MKVKSEGEVAQSCPTLSDPMDCSLPGSSIHGIFQARVLEWGAIKLSNNKCPCGLSHFKLNLMILLAESILYRYREFALNNRKVSFPGGSVGKESTCNAGDLGSVLGLGRSPGEGNGNRLQCSCLENPRDRGEIGRASCRERVLR